VLIELVRAGTAAAPDQPLVVTSDGTETYAGVLERSRSLARGLSERSIERFACVGHAVDVLPLLVASTAVGAEACVYPADLDAAAIETYAKRFGHGVVVTREPLTLAGVDVASPDDLARDGGELSDPPPRAPALILTTGTTGEPRGVRHDWHRLVAAVKHPDDAPGARWLLAYNLNQFAGVQVLIHVLVSRATLVVPASNQPREAVAALRDLGVTHASATPTFWRFVAGLIDDDVHALPLAQITLGGEAVPAPVLQRLERLFPSARVSQVYASNEFGSGVSVKDGRSGLPASVLERGDDADVQMRVVDGELHVRSRVGMLGYYGEPDVDDAWRPTGDLVEIDGDRIVFVGRTSEIINVGGVKVHPLPVEEIVGAIEGVELVHAYGRKNPVAGQIVAVDVVPRAGVDTELLDEQIRDACEALAPAARPRRIRFVDAIEVKGSKIARREGGP
jgi:acyl-CoA synthetase (AMP-forming)/AMP-acid ligase II